MGEINNNKRGTRNEKFLFDDKTSHLSFITCFQMNEKRWLAGKKMKD
jgi:hypothetical protein